MGKAILNTIGFTVIVFVPLAAIKYFTGVEDWLMKTLEWVIPSASGYFLGYWQAQRDENR